MFVNGFLLHDRAPYFTHNLKTAILKKTLEILRVTHTFLLS